MTYALLAVPLLPVLYLALLSVISKKPDTLGVKDGKLAPAPPTPNCVSTLATDEGHRIAPFTFTGTPEEALERLQTIVRAMPRAQIATVDGMYMHAEFTTQLFRYVDDVEFLIDPETKTVHFRSASRAGHYDFGVNRQRMEEIRREFEKK